MLVGIDFAHTSPTKLVLMSTVSGVGEELEEFGDGKLRRKQQRISDGEGVGKRKINGKETGKCNISFEFIE